MARLEEAYGPGRPEVYQDTYYDLPVGALTSADRELRIRTVHGATDTRTVLTYKGARVDEASGSKPEHETRVEEYYGGTNTPPPVEQVRSALFGSRPAATVLLARDGEVVVGLASVSFLRPGGRG
ncbi:MULTISPECIES: CYTH domain-containing protein [unclassified Kitasatospora]|uniref:CYTH domain-containing protein n=1 Tax=unclassified Kitasatospora TaxID=2633591 RepID=UPI002475AF86|nr:CYTH domain-containing protein [Kitasatospora sp. MAP12-44]